MDYDLICVQCKKNFESEPLTIAQCGWVICSHHLQQSNLMCPICPNKHRVNKIQCYNSKNMQIKYLKYKVKKIIKELEIEIKEVYVIKKDPCNHIKEFYSKITNQLDVRRERVKQLIDNHFDVILNQIKIDQINSEKKASENTKLNELNLDELKQKIHLIENTIEQENDTINQFLIMSDCYSKIYNVKKSIDQIMNSLVEYKTYSLTEMSQTFDLNTLFGKVDCQQDQVPSSDPIDELNKIFIKKNDQLIENFETE